MRAFSFADYVTAILLAAAIGVSGGASAADRVNPADAQAIHQLLNNYTQAVTSHDQALFESQLLDQHIPFLCVEDLRRPGFQASTQTVSDYAGFRKAVFEGKTRFHQRFFDVKMEQEGLLAQVSLNFETLVDGTSQGGQGWKTLQLLKVNGQWKIASEFYTVAGLEQPVFMHVR